MGRTQDREEFGQDLTYRGLPAPTSRQLLYGTKDICWQLTEICWVPNILSRIIDTRVEIAVTRSNLINNSPAAYIIRIPNSNNSS